MHRLLCCPKAPALCGERKQSLRARTASLSLPVGSLVRDKEKPALWGLSSSLTELCHFRAWRLRSLRLALSRGDFTPCPSTVHASSGLSLSPKKTLLIAWVVVAFSLFSSQWGLELVANTDLARDLGWSLALHEEQPPDSVSFSFTERPVDS